MPVFRSLKFLALLLIATLLLSGCIGGGKQTQHVRGKVVLGDTDLGLWSTLSLGGHTLTTNEDGTFVVDLHAGTYSFQVSNLLGTFSGTVELKTSGTARLEIPTSVIPEWSVMGFNTFLAHSETSYRTIRWPRYSTLNVWIDEDNPNVTTTARNLAFQAFHDWEDALGGLITFNFVSDRNDAQITLEWDPNEPSFNDFPPNTLGFCRYDAVGRISRELRRASIFIANYNDHSLKTYQHEIGHCLGLGHAYDIELASGADIFVMGRGSHLSEYDVVWLKLLYSIPTGTSRLSGDSNSVLPASLFNWPNDVIYSQ